MTEPVAVENPGDANGGANMDDEDRVEQLVSKICFKLFVSGGFGIS